MIDPKKAFTYLIISAGAMTLLACIFLFKDKAVERYYLWRLDAAPEPAKLAAIEKLRAMRSHAAVPHFLKLAFFSKTSFEIAMAANDALVEFGSAALPGLIHALEGADEKTAKVTALIFLAKLGPESRPALPSLLKQLKKQKPEELYMDGYYFARNYPQANIGPQPAQLLEAEYPYSLLYALSRLGPEAIPDLLACQDQRNQAYNSALQRLMAVIGVRNRAAIPQLYETLRGENRLARSGAASAIGYMLGNVPRMAVMGEVLISPDEVLAVLRKMLDDDNIEVRRRAAFALSRLVCIPEDVDFKLLRGLNETLSDGDGYICGVSAAIILHVQGKDADLEKLFPILISAAVDIYEIKLDFQKFKEIQPASLVPVLSKILKDEKSSIPVRAKAMVVLGELGSEAGAALPALREIWSSARENELRDVAREALMKIAAAGLEKEPAR